MNTFKRWHLPLGLTAWALASACAAFDMSKVELAPAKSTHLVEFAQVSESSRTASGFRAGGYESAYGQWISFDRWYRPSGLKDTRLTWMTQLHPRFGLLWGMSTGEQGEKYRIDPAFKLGFVFQENFGRHAHVSVKASTLLGGRMREHPCTADYGAIGGVQQVNCRLAASTLAPSETLHYLINSAPADRDALHIRFVYEFN